MKNKHSFKINKELVFPKGLKQQSKVIQMIFCNGVVNQYVIEVYDQEVSYGGFEDAVHQALLRKIDKPKGIINHLYKPSLVLYIISTHPWVVS